MCSTHHFLKILLDYYTFNETTITLTFRITLHFSYRTKVKLENFQKDGVAPHFIDDVGALKHSISSFLRSITWTLLSEDSKLLHVFCRGHVESSLYWAGGQLR